ncbi:hypothetical protein JB92DRAFT_3122394 [Gautieria morchelliformis]|nr:hypothetical protein JB92DRAFT_3122394 [Gautieria morchelliformis]
MVDVDVKRIVNPTNVMALLKHVQQEADTFMNLDIRDYAVKLQKCGQFKWRHSTQSSNRELTGFLVGEVSEDSHIGFLGDRMSSVFTGSSQEDIKGKSKELMKLKLKFAFDFPVSVEDHLSADAKKMLNKQLRFLDRLERVGEGKPLDGNPNALSDDTAKPYSVHSWLMSLKLPHSPNKQLRIQAVTPLLWKAYCQQSKESYLYVIKESQFGRMSQIVYHPYGSGIVTNNWLVNNNIDTVDLYGKAINPLEIRNVFTTRSWVVAQVTPTLRDITTQEGGSSCHTKTYQLVINRVQLALKPTDDVKTDHLEGSSLSVLKHRCEDDVQCEESPPLAPAPKRTLLGVGMFSSSPSPATKMPSFKKKKE